MAIKTRQKKCVKCGYEWAPRVGEPKSCPRCKTRLDYLKSNTKFSACNAMDKICPEKRI